MRKMIPMAEVNVQNSAMLEMMVPFLEAAVRIVPENMKEHRRLLADVGQAYGTLVLSSEMNRMITGTGSTAAAYSFVMGFTYFLGRKVKKDFRRSIRYFHEAERSGNTESYLYLGKSYGEGLSGQKYQEKAFKLLERGVHHGYVECLSEVGSCLQDVYGVRRDDRKGFESLQCRASSGSVTAHYELGRRFQWGGGTERTSCETLQVCSRSGAFR